MKNLKCMAPIVLAAVAAPACNGGMTEPEAEDLALRSRPTYESEWVGLYAGLADAEVYPDGRSYKDMPVCIDIRIERPRLYVAVYLARQIVPDEVSQISDDVYAGGAASPCARENDGVVFKAEMWVKSITSRDSLNSFYSRGEDLDGAPKRQDLFFERRGDDVIAEIVIWQEDPTNRFRQSWIEFVKLSLVTRQELAAPESEEEVGR